MLVCHCHVVNDRRIRAEVERGARDEVDVALACGAGTDCGGCLPAVQRVIDECLACPRAAAVGAQAAAGGSAAAVGAQAAAGGSATAVGAQAAAGGSATAIDLTVEIAVG